MSSEIHTTENEAKKTRHRGIWIHGHSIRVDFMYKRERHRHTLGLEPTRANLKHAAGLRAAALFALKQGTYDEEKLFPHSKKAAEQPTRGKRVGELADEYLPLKLVDLSFETEERYQTALAECCEAIGKDRIMESLLPTDIQKLRVALIATRAVSTVNHYLAVFIGFLVWCEANNYCHSLSEHCKRFKKSRKDPDPFSHEEYETLTHKGCIHPIDRAAITVAFYTGLRPGELLALGVEDVSEDFKRIKVRRSITRRHVFKLPKTNKERWVLLFPPAQQAMRVLVEAAKTREPAEIKVWLNRHEWRMDRVRVLLSPETQARKKVVNKWFVPSAWGSKWRNIVRRAGVRYRRPYQTRHTYACWNLTATGNLAFIANQMGHTDYSMLVEVYAAWIDAESPNELERIWEAMKAMRKIVPELSHKQAA